VIFTQAKFKTLVEEILPFDRPSLVVILELEELPYYKHLDVVKEILEKSSYRAKMPAPSRIECTNPLYNVVQYSKFTFLVMAAEINSFKSRKFVWIDAGASRFFENFNTERPLTGNAMSSNGLVMVMERRVARFFAPSAYAQIAWSSANYVRGGMMGGSGESVRRVGYEVAREWMLMIQNEAINNEQIALHLVQLRRKDLFAVFDFFSTANWEKFLEHLSS
jgi:hypothetical protein